MSAPSLLPSTARTRIKICGITRPEDALAVAAVGADAIGLVFYDKSPRAVTIEAAQRIRAVVPPFVTLVGLFVNESADRVAEIAAQVKLELFQFHGQETEAFCSAFDHPYIKAIPVGPDTMIADEVAVFPSAQGILLDTYDPQLEGGTGRAFDWSLIPEGLSKPVILAGGLIPENVGAAIAQAKPYGVDVSGGVEETKGIKSVQKIESFARAVDRAC